MMNWGHDDAFKIDHDNAPPYAPPRWLARLWPAALLLLALAVYVGVTVPEERAPGCCIHHPQGADREHQQHSAGSRGRIGSRSA